MTQRQALRASLRSRRGFSPLARYALDHQFLAADWHFDVLSVGHDLLAETDFSALHSLLVYAENLTDKLNAAFTLGQGCIRARLKLGGISPEIGSSFGENVTRL